MEATKQYFPVVLYIVLCKVVLSFWSVVEMKSYGVNVQLKATDHIFLWYLFLWCTFKMVLSFHSILLLYFALFILQVFSLIIFFKSRIITMRSRHPWHPLTATALGPRIIVILKMKTRRIMVLRDVYGRLEELNDCLLIPFSDWYFCWSHKKIQIHCKLWVITEKASTIHEIRVFKSQCWKISRISSQS